MKLLYFCFISLILFYKYRNTNIYKLDSRKLQENNLSYDDDTQFLLLGFDQYEYSRLFNKIFNELNYFY